MVGALLLLVGCGQPATVDDPFVGTWTDSARPDLSLTISKQGVEYVAVAYSDGVEDLRIAFIPDADDGNHLTAKQLPQGFFNKPGVRYDPASGHLQFSPFGKNVDLQRTSTSAP
jgi:hypothetical protein